MAVNGKAKAPPAPGGARGREDDGDVLDACYRAMLRIRMVEERLAKLFADREIPGFIHLSVGQEAVPVGVSRHLRASDTITITHRGHGQALAKGVDLNGFFAEMLGRDGGVCRGRGGSMHIADRQVGMLGANGIVAGGISIAVGSALAHKLRGDGDIAVAYFGDGALAEGIFHECLNLAALWTLPCLFVCENNGWGEFTRTDRQFCGVLGEIADAFGVTYRYADGVDVLTVAEVAGHLVEQIRADRRPAVLECKVERFHGHFEGDPQRYRAADELEALAGRDPVAQARARLIGHGAALETLDAIAADIAREIDAAVDFARASPLPSFEQARGDVYAH